VKTGKAAFSPFMKSSKNRFFIKKNSVLKSGQHSATALKAGTMPILLVLKSFQKFTSFWHQRAKIPEFRMKLKALLKKYEYMPDYHQTKAYQTTSLKLNSSLVSQSL
jgi:hypothetical protein